MPLQNFIDNNLPTIKAAWLNAIDVLHVTVFDSAATKAQARTAIDVPSNAEAVLDADLGTGVATALALPITAFASTVLDDATAVAARTTLGAAASDSPTFTGVASFPAGTAAAPSVKVGDDGFYSPAANKIGIATGGVERATVDGNGVLAHTSTSGGDFVTHTSSAAGSETALRVDNTQATSGSALKVSNSGINKQIALRVNGTGGADIYVGQTAGAGSTAGVAAITFSPTGVISLIGAAPATGFGNAGDITAAVTNAIKSRSTFSFCVRHNSAGTISRALNVGSVTKNGTGDFTANITASVMADGGYVPFTCSEKDDGNAQMPIVLVAPTATALRYRGTNGAGTAVVDHDAYFAGGLP